MSSKNSRELWKPRPSTPRSCRNGPLSHSAKVLTNESPAKGILVERAGLHDSDRKSAEVVRTLAESSGPSDRQLLRAAENEESFPASTSRPRDGTDFLTPPRKSPSAPITGVYVITEPHVILCNGGRVTLPRGSRGLRTGLSYHVAPVDMVT